MSYRHFFTLPLLTAAVAGQQAAAQAGARSTAARDSVMALERSAWDALLEHDYARFNARLGANFMYVDEHGAYEWDRAQSAELMRDCVTGRWSLDDMHATPEGPRIIVVTYRASGKQVCAGRASASPMNAMSVWEHRAGRWVVVAHSETPATPAPR